MSSDAPEPVPPDPGPEKKPRPKPRKPPKAAESAVPGERVETRTETKSSPPESPTERASRLRREERREANDIFNERAVLVTALVVVGVIGLSSLGILLVSRRPELLNWATASLSSMLTGCLGYLVGKRESSKTGK